MQCDWQLNIPVVKDFILATAAIVTSSVAVFGLRKWREELRGRTEYEVARRVIRGLYKVRDGFRTVRSPMVWAHEYPEGNSGSAGTTSSINEKTADMHVYQNRWKYLAEAFVELEAETLEAEVLWGGDIEKLMREIRSCRAELLISLREYFAKLERVPDNREQYRQVMEKIAAFDDEDPLSKRTAAAIGALEARMRRHLRH
jgi:hypothetical protein